MGSPTLVVRHGDLESMQQLLTTARESLDSTLAAARDEVDRTLVGWSKASASRQAQLVFARNLEQAHVDLLGGLDQLARTLAEIREDARHAEARCVAILD